ncbi:MAG: hypothetical protein NVV63_11720 [Opitutus sp.]|nr:hypothetical protein [Opitutus sp.]
MPAPAGISARQTASISAGPARHDPRDLVHGAHLDGAEPRHRNARGEADGVVEVACFDEDEAGELFLGLDERPVGGRHVPLPYPYQHGAIGRLQRFGDDQVAVGLQLHVIGERIAVELLLALGIERLEGFGGGVDEADIAHGELLRSGLDASGRMARIRPIDTSWPEIRVPPQIGADPAFFSDFNAPFHHAASRPR